MSEESHLPNYMPPLLALAPLFERGHMYDVLVRHDDWCAFWRGEACDCNPEIEVSEMEP